VGAATIGHGETALTATIGVKIAEIIATTTVVMTGMMVSTRVVAVRLQEGGHGFGCGHHCTTPWVYVTCHICNKEGHPVRDCWWRFDDDDTN
jgi:hypothetical protein